jgi:hypothetical protein
VNIDPPIQTLWIGDRLSELENLCITSYIKQGYDFHLYAYNDIENVPSDCMVLDGNAILDESEIFCYNVGVGKGSYSAFSNLFRYKLLLDEGGIWTDTDVICLNRFPTNSEYIFASEKDSSVEGENIVCSSNFIKAPKGSDFAKYCYKKAAAVDRNNLQWGTIGPRLVGEAVASHGLNDFVLSFKRFNHVPWYNSEIFFIDEPQDFGDLIYESINSDAYCIHLWNEVWRRNGIDKNSKFPEKCFFEILKSKIRS